MAVDDIANKYWVNDGGIWSTGHFSNTNGGASGASLPTSADKTLLTAASFSTSGTITISGTANSSYIDATGLDQTVVITGGILNLTASGGTTTLSSLLTINTTIILLGSAAQAIRTNGCYLTLLSPQSTGSIMLVGEMNIGTLAIYSGGCYFETGVTFNIANLYVYSYASSKVISLSAGTILNCNVFHTVGGESNLTVSLNASSLVNVTTEFHSGKTIPNVTATNPAVALRMDSALINNFVAVAGKTVNMASFNMYFYTSFAINGTANSPCYLSLIGSNCNLNLPGSTSINYCTITGMYAIGSTPYYTVHSTNGGGNTNFLFQNVAVSKIVNAVYTISISIPFTRIFNASYSINNTLSVTILAPYSVYNTITKTINGVYSIITTRIIKWGSGVQYREGGIVKYGRDKFVNNFVSLLNRRKLNNRYNFAKSLFTVQSLFNGGNFKLNDTGINMFNSSSGFTGGVYDDVNKCVTTGQDIIMSSITADSQPSEVYVIGDEVLGTGTISYYLSRDGGTTYTGCINGLSSDITSQPSGVSIVLKIVITGNAKLNSVYWGWK